MESLRFLISHSARVNAPSDNGETALLLAAQRGQLGLVKQVRCHRQEFALVSYLDMSIPLSALD